MNIITERIIKQRLLSGRVRLTNNAEFHYSPAGEASANIRITRFGGDDTEANFSAKACREAAEFFTRMAHVLEAA